MPQYVVQLVDSKGNPNGEMRVNASSPEAARDNVASTGNTPAGGSSGGSSGGGSAPPQDKRATGTNEYGDGLFSTPNGQKTGTQIIQELQKAGWNGQGDPIDVYNRTASGGAQPAAAGTPAGTPAGDAAAKKAETEKLTNLTAAQMALTQAKDAAYQAYLNARLQLDNDTLAFQKATEAFNESIKTAEMTGKFNGADTQAAIKQAADIAAQQAGLTGTFNGAPTLAAQQQYFTQGLDTQKFQQNTAQQYLQLLSQLRGPQDYGQYLRVLGSTPQGMRDLVGAAAGQFVPGTGATTGVQPNPASLAGTINQATGYQPAATGAPAAGGGTNYDQYMAAARGLPAPNQIAPQSWNAMTDTQRKLLLGMYEQGGWNTQDVQDLYKQSLPTFGAQQPQAGQFRLQ